MFDGMGFSEIWASNGGLPIDFDFLRGLDNFCRFLTLILEEKKKKNVLAAVDRVNQLDFVFLAELSWHMDSYGGPEAPATELKYRYDLVMVTLEKEYSLLDIGTITSMFRDTEFFLIADVNGKLLIGPGPGLDMDSYRRTVALWLKKPSQSNLLAAVERVGQLGFVSSASPYFYDPLDYEDLGPTQYMPWLEIHPEYYHDGQISIFLKHEYSFLPLKSIESKLEEFGLEEIYDVNGWYLDMHPSLAMESTYRRGIMMNLKDKSQSNVEYTMEQLSQMDYISEVKLGPIIIPAASSTVEVFKFGDLNRDGKVNSLDLACALLYVEFTDKAASWDTYSKVNDAYGIPITAKNCDVSGDGKVNMTDLLIIMFN
jgi:hypothetical protein